ncbi:MAG: L-serine ammonia-lyase [Pseudomonadota bacterium]
MTAVSTSIFDLFKIGPGPSSSHTVGPMLAGGAFIRTAAELPAELRRQATGIRVHLFGSLSATGKGHGTDRAVLAGLMGDLPETCSSERLQGLLRDARASYRVRVGDVTVDMTGADIVFDRVVHDFPFSNTLVIRLCGDGGSLFEREYYSVGGGFIRWKDQAEPQPEGAPVYPYETMNQFQQQCRSAGVLFETLLIANETAVTGVVPVEIASRMDHIMAVMDAAVRSGLEADGVLPGPIGLQRKAARLFNTIEVPSSPAHRLMARLNAYALAASEENAAGGIVVTAPTLGSCGIIPAVLRLLKHNRRMRRDRLRRGLWAAALVGFLVKHNASIAGADVGCQGEVGTASAMAAALLCGAHDFGIDIIASAAEIALEHHLGLTCDPVMGYVQIPCIERNAMGAVKAYNAFLLASMGDAGRQKVGFDAAVAAMRETGRDMSSKYKETSQGGLAVSVVGC